MRVDDVAGFRGDADYMETEAFRAALDDLIAAAGETPTAITCAERSGGSVRYRRLI